MNIKRLVAFCSMLALSTAIASTAVADDAVSREETYIFNPKEKYLFDDKPTGNRVTPSDTRVVAPSPIELYSPPEGDYEEEVIPPGGFQRKSASNQAGPAVMADPNVIPRYKKAYKSKKRPRIALYHNRVLSDAVVVWSSGKVGEDSHADGRNDDGAGTQWAWEFESELVNHFVSTGTRTVDRATIIRLMGTETPEMLKTTQRHEYDARYFNDGINVKNIEMNALKGYADIFVEIVISRQLTAQQYEFKAQAIEVNTGQVKAHVSSAGKQLQSAKVDSAFVTTEHGYEEVLTVYVPSASEVARWLALELMDRLTRSWNAE